VVTCELFNEVVLDIGTRAWSASSKTYAGGGPCRYGDWRDTLIVLSCWVH
jgi:hypothetical protein